MRQRTNQQPTSSVSRTASIVLAGLLAVAGTIVFAPPAEAGVCLGNTSVLCVASSECGMGGTCLPGICSFTAQACDFTATYGCPVGEFCQIAPVEDGCMEDVAGFNLQCTAEDVKVAKAYNVMILDDGCTSASDTVTLSFDIEVLLEAQDRHDIGLYFSLDSGDALNGMCRIEGLPYQGTFTGIDAQCIGLENPFRCCTGPGTGTCDGSYVDLDGTVTGVCSLRDSLACDNKGPNECVGSCNSSNRCANAEAVPCTTNADCNFGSCVLGSFQDTCGDISGPISGPNNPIFHTVSQVTLQCDDTDGDGYLDVAVCTSWRQPGANELCTSPLDAYPGTPAKCKCQPAFQIPVPVPRTIEVQKVAIDLNDTGFPDDARFVLQIDDGAVWSQEVFGCDESPDPPRDCTTGPVDISGGFCSATTTTACTTNADCPMGEYCNPADRTVSELAGTNTFLDNYNKSVECVSKVGFCASVGGPPYDFCDEDADCPSLDYCTFPVVAGAF